MADKSRVVELQKQLKITRDALTRIKNGCNNPSTVADDALYRLMPFDNKYQLQGIVGHERRTA